MEFERNLEFVREFRIPHSRFQLPSSGEALARPVRRGDDRGFGARRASSRSDSRLRFDQRILLLALAAGFPAALVALILLWTGDYTPKVQWTLTVFVIGVWTGCSFSVRQRVVLPLQTLSNLLAALRESDFSIRARGAERRRSARRGDARGQRARLDAARSAARRARSRRAAAHGDGGDRRRRLHFRRRADAASRQPRRRTPARAAAPNSCSDAPPTSSGSSACLAGASPRIEDVAFPGASGRWEVRRTTFRQDGRPHQLLVLADVSRPLRDEERQAWQRLIRVIGHEINNSLAPIKSIAGSLESMLARRRGVGSGD